MNNPFIEEMKARTIAISDQAIRESAKLIDVAKNAKDVSEGTDTLTAIATLTMVTQDLAREDLKTLIDHIDLMNKRVNDGQRPERAEVKAFAEHTSRTILSILVMNYFKGDAAVLLGSLAPVEK